MVKLQILVCLFFIIFQIASARPQLERDNPSHRGWSNTLDNKFEDSKFDQEYARPSIHGTYHAGRYLGSGNSAEWARAKDQFSKIGTGEQRTDYLRQHNAQQKKH